MVLPLFFFFHRSLSYSSYFTFPEPKTGSKFSNDADCSERQNYDLSIIRLYPLKT